MESFLIHTQTQTWKSPKKGKIKNELTDADDVGNVLTQPFPLLRKFGLSIPFFKLCSPENQTKVKYQVGLTDKAHLDWRRTVHKLEIPHTDAIASGSPECRGLGSYSLNLFREILATTGHKALKPGPCLSPPSGSLASSPLSHFL